MKKVIVSFSTSYTSEFRSAMIDLLKGIKFANITRQVDELTFELEVEESKLHIFEALTAADCLYYKEA